MIRVYGIREKLNPIKAKLSDVINQCMADALSFPDNKRAHRFMPMDVEITIIESPACNWGFRGVTGDEAKLNYKVII